MATTPRKIGTGLIRANHALTCGAVSVSSSTSTKVCDENPGRGELTIVNDSSNVIYLALSTDGAAPTAVANSGIRLNASGGSYTTNSYTGIVHALAMTGTSVVTVTEV